MISSSRPETLAFLKVFGVELPPKTTLTTDMLEQKLRKTLDCAQYITDAMNVDGPGKKLLDIASLQPWSNGSVQIAIMRGLMSEAIQNQKKMLAGETKGPPLGLDPLMDVRQTVLSIAKHFDMGVTEFCSRDQTGSSAIIIRVLGVLERHKEVPVILLLYINGTNKNLKGEDWMQYQRGSGNPRQLGNISSTFLEHQLLLRLLEMNSKRLPSSYKPKRGPYEENFTKSFLIPVGPLDFNDKGRLNANDGCPVCGQKGIKKCAGCTSILYCSSECQKYDWRGHKAHCKALEYATWTTIRFSPVPPTEEYTVLHREDNLVGRPKQTPLLPGSLDAPPNTHGTGPFLLKIQYKSDTSPMWIYDEPHTFSVLFGRSRMYPEAAALFDKVAAVIKELGKKELGEKIYCWARRTGEWHIDLALDSLPDQGVDW